MKTERELYFEESSTEEIIRKICDNEYGHKIELSVRKRIWKENNSEFYHIGIKSLDGTYGEAEILLTKIESKQLLDLLKDFLND
jgi:hypothetical protein